MEASKLSKSKMLSGNDPLKGIMALVHSDQHVSVRSRMCEHGTHLIHVCFTFHLFVLSILIPMCHLLLKSNWIMVVNLYE